MLKLNCLKNTKARVKPLLLNVMLLATGLTMMTGALVSVSAETALKNELLPSAQTPDFLAIQQIMKVVGQVNIPQMDRASKSTFESFFQQKRNFDEPVEMLEKATSSRQGSAANAGLHGNVGPLKAPPRVSPKAF
jgi:hypothetical protein